MADDIFARLAAPFDPDQVTWRVGSTNKRAWEKDNSKPKRGMALAFIDARDVMRRLDEVVGPAHWQCRYVPMPNGTSCCEIGIRVSTDPVEWIWKANGAGATGNTRDENEREMAEKGGYSDAFKRAAVLWGIGQYLYDIASPWVALTDRWEIADDELQKLKALLRGEKPKSAYQARKDGGSTDYQRIEKALRDCRSISELQEIWKAEQPVIRKWPDNWQETLTAEKDRVKAELMKQAA